MPDSRGRLQRIIVRWLIITSSIVLLIVGEILFYFSLPGAHGFWRASLALIAGALVDAGAISLIFEFISLRKLVNQDIVEALLSNEKFLSSLSQDELLRQLRRFIQARYPDSGKIDDATVEWLLTTISAPSRSGFSLDVQLLGESEKVSERFSETGDVPDVPVPKAAQVLHLEARIRYQTAQNRSRHPLLINGNGVIDTLFKTIPEETEFARRYRHNDLTIEEAAVWVQHIFQPKVSLSIKGEYPGVSIVPIIKRLLLIDGADGQLSITFDITSEHKLRPGQQASVTYTHRQLSDVSDAYVWSASAPTSDGRIRMLGFSGYTLIPIANPTARSSVQDLYFLSDEIRCTGLILPQSSFAFSWSPKIPRASVPAPASTPVPAQPAKAIEPAPRPDGSAELESA